MHEGSGKGGKKRSEPTSSSEESPPRPLGAVGSSKVSGQSKPGSSLSPDKLTVGNPSSLKRSPSKLEEIARQHRISRSGIIQNLTDDQIGEVGVRIFRRWAWLRQKLRGKSGGIKKSRVSADEVEDEEKSIPVEKSELPDMVDLVNQEIKQLEQVRIEAEYDKDRREEAKIQEQERVAEEAWELYRFRKEATSHHKVKDVVAVTFLESMVLVNRLTDSFDRMQIKMSEPSASAFPEHPPEELETFYQDLQETRDRLSSQSSSDDSRKDASGSSKVKNLRKPSRDESSFL